MIAQRFQDIKLVLLDMDGTIYLQDRLFDGVKELLAYFKRHGIRAVYLTNNSARSVQDYILKLRRMGIETTEEDFFTSAQATEIDLLKNHACDKIYVVGTESLKQQFRAAGLRIAEAPEEDVSVLVSAYDTELTYQKLEDACILLGRGVDYIATNPDWVCPTWYGYAPDCGSISTMLKNATGRWPRFIGKPEPVMPLMAVQRAGCRRDQAIMVGDRIYTDIASGVNAGISTLLVLSGEATMQDAERSEIKPEFILPDLNELYKLLTE